MRTYARGKAVRIQANENRKTSKGFDFENDEDKEVKP
jgi:hypothetical protein